MIPEQDTYYLFKNKENEYLCRSKEKLYFSSIQADRVVSYRSEHHAKNFLKDEQYFNHRNIDVSELTLVKCKLLIIPESKEAP